MSARYPVVLFDVGETLVGPQESYGAVYARVLRELGLALPVERLERGIREVATELARTIPAGTDRFSHFPGGETEFWFRFLVRVLRKSAGQQVETDLARRALGRLRTAFSQPSAWRVYDDVVPALSELRDDGVRMGVVSNWDSQLPRVLELLKLAEYFDTIGVSHVERVEKPDPVLFDRVLERLGASPGQALHVGNSPELDLDGARAAGIECVLVDRQAMLKTDNTVADLRELPPIVRGERSPSR